MEKIEKTLWGMLIAFLTLFFLMAACSCTRKVYIPIEKTTIRQDTLRQTALRIDSVLMRDTVHIRTIGDTVYTTTTRWRDRYRERHDTLWRTQIRTDTIPVTIQVPAPKTAADIIITIAGKTFLLLLLLALILTAAYLLRRR